LTLDLPVIAIYLIAANALFYWAYNALCKKLKLLHDCSSMRYLNTIVFTLASCGLAGSSWAMGLMVEPAPPLCGVAALAPPAPPIAAAQRLEGSQVARGHKDIAWAWLGNPTVRYPHPSLGSRVHAASLHVLIPTPAGTQQEVVYRLPLHRVFEDLIVRLADLDADGRDDIIVVESDAVRGSAVVVLGLRNQTLTEIARSPYAGSTFHWLNPVGVADFDGDGRLDVASVTTPHIGGVLTLYHFRPPQLVPFAKAMDTSNHRMGDPEQQLSVIVELPSLRPTIILPDMGLKALHALRWDTSPTLGAAGQWKELADVMALPARVQRMLPLPRGACVLLADDTWRRVTLAQ
jgi:FG-GAP-like repeat